MHGNRRAMIASLVFSLISRCQGQMAYMMEACCLSLNQGNFVGVLTVGGCQGLKGFSWGCYSEIWQFWNLRAKDTDATPSRPSREHCATERHFFRIQAIPLLEADPDVARPGIEKMIENAREIWHFHEEFFKVGTPGMPGSAILRMSGSILLPLGWWTSATPLLSNLNLYSRSWRVPQGDWSRCQGSKC